MKIIKQELEFEECLKQRLEFICEFSKVTPIFINGSIRKLERTNINFGKYKLVMFAMAKLIEMETTEQNKVALYLFNCMN